MNRLRGCRFLSSLVRPEDVDNSVINFVKSKIKISGPLTVAEYMKAVLTSQTGYYMTNDVFGKEGDFVTSPEMSQLFGEMIGVWSVNELMKLNFPRPLQIVELGPGRGTMTGDILQIFTKFRLTEEVSVHLVEVSPTLSKIQSHKLCTKSDEVNDKPFYRHGVTPNNIPVYWYRSVNDIPNDGFTCLFANEFFDALPIHKFQKTADGWREILIDEIDSELKFVLCKMHTPALTLLKEVTDEKDHIEICPEAGIIMENLASKFEKYGGMALVIDYGHTGEKGDTFRAFKSHKLHEPLSHPGSADLTADVDFSYLKKAVKDKLITFGPTSQADFLKKVHIETRLEKLLKSCKSEEERSKVMGSYKMLVDKNQMGERFKVMSFFPAILTDFLKKYPVEGF